MDPIHQFEIKNLLPIARIGGIEIALTNSALFMMIALALILLLMLGATSSRALVPGRLQAVAEMSYEFVATIPLGLTVALTALELLVAVLQAYVFAILTCIYLSEAIHAGH